MMRGAGGVCQRVETIEISGPNGLTIEKRNYPGVRIVTGLIMSDGITFTYVDERSRSAVLGRGSTVAGAAPTVNLDVTLPTEATSSTSASIGGPPTGFRS